MSIYSYFDEFCMVRYHSTFPMISDFVKKRFRANILAEQYMYISIITVCDLRYIFILWGVCFVREEGGAGGGRWGDENRM